MALLHIAAVDDRSVDQGQCALTLVSGADERCEKTTTTTTTRNSVSTRENSPAVDSSVPQVALVRYREYLTS